MLLINEHIPACYCLYLVHLGYHVLEVLMICFLARSNRCSVKIKTSGMGLTDKSVNEIKSFFSWCFFFFLFCLSLFR